MTDAESKKEEIAFLWGITTEQIDEKLDTLKAIIDDSSDYSLLELLLRSDLNIETAIGRYFSGNTPSPSLQSNNQNQQNSSTSNIESKVDESSPSTTTASIPESSSSTNSPSLRRRRRRRRRRKPVIPVSKEESPSPNILQSASPDPMDETESTSMNIDHDESEDPLLVLPPRASPPSNSPSTSERSGTPDSPPRNRRKRGRSTWSASESESEYNPDEERLNFRARKKRKLNQSTRRRVNEPSHSNSHNTNNSRSYTNSSSRRGRRGANSRDNDTVTFSVLPPTENPTASRRNPKRRRKVNRNWKEKKIGTLCIKYKDLFEAEDVSALIEEQEKRNKLPYNHPSYRSYNCSLHWRGENIPKDVESIEDLRRVVSHRNMEIVSATSQNWNGKDKHALLLYDEAVRYQRRKENEERQEKQKWIKKQLNKQKNRKKKKTREQLSKEFTPNRRTGVTAEMSKKERKAVKKKDYEYTVAINLSFSRLDKKTTDFHIHSPFCVAACSNSKELRVETLKCHDIVDEYEKEKHSFSMASLLDFTCRYSHDPNDHSDNYDHGLNITLHQYQLQSLKWMLEEENHPNGFHRHLYHEGCFGDNVPFIFSPIFNRLIFTETIPVAHGGLLCEEMGLGKTIISLALIHAQKPRDLSGYSTKRHFVISHSEMRTETKMDLSDPENPRSVTVTQEYKWYKSRATLIIAPTSLVGQWETECDERCDGRLQWKRYYGGNRSRKVRDYIDNDIVFTTYGIIALEKGEDRKKHVLQQIEWNRIILDESHSIKNMQTGQSKSVAALRGRNRWCLTGTPFGTKVIDLENQLRFIGMRSEDINTLQLKEVAKSKVFQSHSRYKMTAEKDEAKPLLSLIRHVTMRHKKDQKFNDEPIVSMPEKEEIEVLIEFTPSQKEYYDKLYKVAKEKYDYYASINSVSRASLQILSSLHPARSACSGFVCSKNEIEEQLSSAEAQSFHIRSMVQKVADQNLSSKELFAMAAEKAFADKDGECPICFECPLDDPLQTPCRHIFCRECIVDILREKGECPMCRRRVNPKDLKKPKGEDNDDDDEMIDEEGLNEEAEAEKNQNDEGDDDGDDIIRFDAKINRLMAELTKIKRDRPNEKSLIFTSFSKSLDWICSELKRNGFSYRTLTGNMTMNKRKKELDQFANDDDVKVFVLTVRAGAVGITLTAANHVFVMEPTLNPALHRQAINRVYRLGQRRKVMIHTMIMRDSIEQRIWNVIHKENGRRRNEKEENDTDDEQQGGSEVGGNVSHSGGKNNIAGNISSDRRARLESSIIDKLFQ